MATRVKIAEFGIIQKMLGLAVVAFYEADEAGQNTGVKAVIYQDETGPAARENPQTLDEDGKLRNECWVEAQIVAAITGITERTERAIRKIRQNPLEFQLPITCSSLSSAQGGGSSEEAEAFAELSRDWAIKLDGLVEEEDFSSKEYARGTQGGTGGSARSWAQHTPGDVPGAALNTRSAKAWAQEDLKGATLGGSAKDWAQTPEDVTVDGAEYSAKHYAAKTAADAAATADDRVQTGEDRIAADNSALSAAASASDAQISANEAESYKEQVVAIADSMAFQETIFLSSADSPYTFDATSNGTLFSIDTSGGAFVGTLPVIADLLLPFTIGFKKATGDANSVTINSSGTDTINDDTETSKVITSLGGTVLYASDNPSPDRWTGADFGASAGEEKRQVFEAGTDFTPGTTTQLTLSVSPVAGTSDGLDIVFDGVSQISSEWSYAPNTGVITFSEAIPVYTQKVEARWRSSLVVGVPADGSISWLKLASGLIATVSDIVSGTVNKLVTASAMKEYLTPTTTTKTASGTSVTFSGDEVPAWATKIRVALVGVSGSGTSPFLLQLGDTSPETSGYLATGYVNAAQDAHASGFPIANNGAYGNTTSFTTVLDLVLIDGRWHYRAQGVAQVPTNPVWCQGAGVKTITGDIGVVRLTTVNGTDTFDAGSVSIVCER